jgi:hypothetical protein
MTKFCRNGIRFFSRNIQKRARQYLTMQILVQTHIHTEHWFYRHIHKKSPLSCANKRNLSGPNLKASSNRLHILGSLVSQRSQKKLKKKMSLPSPSFWAGKLTRKTKYRHEKMDLLLSAWLENLFLEKKKRKTTMFYRC